MANHYAERLLQQLAEYKARELAGIAEAEGARTGELSSAPYVLPHEHRKANILPSIHDRFWAEFDAQTPPVALDPDFHHLDSGQAMAFNLFFPFVHAGGVDPRLLRALGIAAKDDYVASFCKVPDPDDDTRSDFYMEARPGRLIFFDVKLSQDDLGRRSGDEALSPELAPEYEALLREHVDAKWLEPANLAANEQMMRKLSWLCRHPDSGLVFIFPRANERLMESEERLKHIVSKSLAPRIAILYLEYLVERILRLVEGDQALREHFLHFRAKYVVAP